MLRSALTVTQFLRHLPLAEQTACSCSLYLLPQFQLRDHLAGKYLQSILLQWSQVAWQTVNHTQSSQRVAVFGDQGRSGIKANVGSSATSGLLGEARSLPKRSGRSACPAAKWHGRKTPDFAACFGASNPTRDLNH